MDATSAAGKHATAHAAMQGTGKRGSHKAASAQPSWLELKTQANAGSGMHGPSFQDRRHTQIELIEDDACNTYNYLRCSHKCVLSDKSNAWGPCMHATAPKLLHASARAHLAQQLPQLTTRQWKGVAVLNTGSKHHIGCFDRLLLLQPMR